ncbi:MAG: SDR family oxidoreductase [Pseudomonadota bacterium]
MSGQCEGKVGFVTGAGSGIGRAASLALAREGAKVLVTDLNFEGCEETVKLITDGGGSAVALKLNVADEVEVGKAVRKAADDFGTLDIAFNNAGIAGPMARISEYPDADYHQVIATNLTGVWFCMKHEINVMRETGGGSIINTASAAGLVGTHSASAYCAAKHGVVGMTKSVALEYAKSGIRVNAVCPGGIKTNMVASADRDYPGFASKLEQNEPMGRLGEPEEIANAVVWLGSDSSSFTTGTTLAVDGGYTAR